MSLSAHLLFLPIIFSRDLVRAGRVRGVAWGVGAWRTCGSFDSLASSSKATVSEDFCRGASTDPAPVGGEVGPIFPNSLNSSLRFQQALSLTPAGSRRMSAEAR